MSWKQNLQKASFRGVPFHVDGASEAGGRRIVTHNMPLRDDPIHEDLGAANTTFTIEAFVLGADYFAARDALLGAVTSAGVGQLIHPFKGALNVVCKSYKMRENFRQGGMAMFTLEFEKASNRNQPRAYVDTNNLLKSTSNSVIQSAKGDFITSFSIKGMPDFVVKDAEGSVKAFADFISKAITSGESKGKALLNLMGGQLKTGAGYLVEDPDALATNIQNMIGTVKDAYESNPVAKAAVMKAMESFKASDDYSPFETAARIRQAKNSEALTQLIKRTAIAHESEYIASTTFDSHNTAVSNRDSVAIRIDDLAIISADNEQPETYLTLTDMRAAFVKDMSERNSELPRIVKVEQQTTAPSLVVANRLYGDKPELVAISAEDIAKRNEQKHPGFVTGGDVEVLSHA